jgi:hypothetical protein
MEEKRSIFEELRKVFDLEYEGKLNIKELRQSFERTVTDMVNDLFKNQKVKVFGDTIELSDDIEIDDFIALLPYSGRVNWFGKYRIQQKGKYVAEVQYSGKSFDPQSNYVLSDTVYVGANTSVKIIAPMKAISFNFEIVKGVEEE